MPAHTGFMVSPGVVHPMWSATGTFRVPLLVCGLCRELAGVRGKV